MNTYVWLSVVFIQYGVILILLFLPFTEVKCTICFKKKDYFKKTSSIVVQDIPIPFIEKFSLLSSSILNTSGN